VILPPSKLSELESNQNPLPFTFQLVPLGMSALHNNNNNNNNNSNTHHRNKEVLQDESEKMKKQTHCGVLEFTSPEDIAYVPHRVHILDS
jgi:FtsZ-binding cell division protein ZapB